MTKNRRVFNLSRPGYTLKHRQAERAVAQCAAEWVEYGVSIRDLSLGESIAARNEQARLREPLPSAEIPGLTFDFDRAAVSREMNLAWQAGAFAAGLVA